MKNVVKVFAPVYANDNTALNPTIWAKFSLAILESNMVAGNLIYRDFEAALQDFGNVVNTRKPSTFKAYRKTDADLVTVQDASLTNIAVTLNQHPHVSFIIKDGEESLAMESLIAIHLEPAMIAMAEHIDSIVLGQYAQFLFGPNGKGSTGGTLGGLTSSNYKQFLAETAQRLDEQKCPAAGRSICVPPAVKSLILETSVLTNVNERGDAGSALREANMGRIYAFDHFMCQNAASVGAGSVNTNVTFLIGTAAPATTTVLVVKTGTGVIATGTWLTIAGYVHQVTAHTETIGNTTGLTVKPGLRAAVAVNDVVTVYTPGAVDLIAGYAAGFASYITVEDFTNLPAVGQFVSFQADLTNVYTVIDVVGSTILLDKPLVIALADEDAVNAGPNGLFSLAFSRNAMALVVRPLKLPKAGAGAIAGTASHNGFAMRVVITYDGNKQGHLVTLDCLLGIAVLDTSYGAVLLG